MGLRSMPSEVPIRLSDKTRRGSSSRRLPDQSRWSRTNRCQHGEKRLHPHQRIRRSHLYRHDQWSCDRSTGEGHHHCFHHCQCAIRRNGCVGGHDHQQRKRRPSKGSLARRHTFAGSIVPLRFQPICAQGVDRLFDTDCIERSFERFPSPTGVELDQADSRCSRDARSMEPIPRELSPFLFGTSGSRGPIHEAAPLPPRPSRRSCQLRCPG